MTLGTTPGTTHLCRRPGSMLAEPGFERWFVKYISADAGLCQGRMLLTSSAPFFYDHSAYGSNAIMLLVSTSRRPCLRVQRLFRPGSNSIRLPSCRSFYSDLYENEGHLFDRNRDENRSSTSVTSPSPFQNQHSRFSTSQRSAYEVERQMHRVSSASARVSISH